MLSEQVYINRNSETVSFRRMVAVLYADEKFKSPHFNSIRECDDFVRRLLEKYLGEFCWRRQAGGVWFSASGRIYESAITYTYLSIMGFLDRRKIAALSDEELAINYQLVKEKRFWVEWKGEVVTDTLIGHWIVAEYEKRLTKAKEFNSLLAVFSRG